MTFTEARHAELVLRLKKDPRLISTTALKKDVMHMILGIAGETGELVDCVKKYLIYEQDLDREHVVEELGDLEFYLEGLRQTLAIPRELVLEENIKKLNKRYPAGGYTDKDAEERQDKKLDWDAT